MVAVAAVLVKKDGGAQILLKIFKIYHHMNLIARSPT
jgi:hypothetical protein